MKILLGPISLPGLISIDPEILENPGIGGSEFHTIALASVLSQKHDVLVWVENGELEMKGVKVVQFPEEQEVYNLQIAFTSKADRWSTADCPLIAISHHPFDTYIEYLPARTRAIVNVGAYQLLTNVSYANKVGIPQFWLPIFFGKAGANTLFRSEDFKVGHLSSLHPSKGFHDVLAGWMKYLAGGGRGTLQVIGGQSLYGLAESHEILPTSKEYGDRLMRIMGGDVNPTVEFIGRVVGVQRYVGNWHVAVLNPKAFGESVNISLADCWREGTPVIAGNRFGQRDSMRLTPGLATSSPKRIGHLLRKLNQDRKLLEEYQTLSKSSYEILYLRGEESKARWIELVAEFLDYPKKNRLAGLEIGRFTLSLKVKVAIDRFMVRAQRLASKVLLFLRRFKTAT
jgi:hypothetical protein